MKKNLYLSVFAFAASVALFVNCSPSPSAVGEKVDALDASAWESAKWISAVDAPVVHDGNNGRAADGASWFVSTVKNERKVASAKWMTTGLGVYQLYLNGKPVGEEFLKPGFTHVLKTRRSFTYDITDAFECGADSENQLSAQVTPGWWADKIVTRATERCGARSALSAECWS